MPELTAFVDGRTHMLQVSFGSCMTLCVYSGSGELSHPSGHAHSSSPLVREICTSDALDTTLNCRVKKDP